MSSLHGDGEASEQPQAAFPVPMPDSGPPPAGDEHAAAAQPPGAEVAAAAAAGTTAQEGPSGIEAAQPMMATPTQAAGGGGLGPPRGIRAPVAMAGGLGGLRANKRMPRDPVTNARICYEFVQGACARPPGTCRYAHVVPPHATAHAIQAMRPFGAGVGSAAGPAGVGGLPAPSPLLQHHLQQLSR
jgi:hypothetical protein